MTSIVVKNYLKNIEDINDPAQRSKCGSFAGKVGIGCNIVLFIAKLLIGILSGSVSIMADAINNLSDAASSIMTLIGFWIAKKPADSQHPYGHARFEYISGLVIAAFIMIIGYQLGIESIKKIFHPEAVEISTFLIIVLVISILIKLWMGYFYMSFANIINSTSLKAAAVDSRNDVITTTAVLIATVVEAWTGWKLDGFVGFLVACFILYSSIGIVKETISPLLGESADEEFVEEITRDTLNYSELIIGVHDLMVHDYGPGKRFASEHVEVDSSHNVIEVHEMIDDLEKYFLTKYNLHMVIHYDPVVSNDEEVNKLKDMIKNVLKEINEDYSLHDFRVIKKEEGIILFDMEIPYSHKEQKENIEEMLMKKMVENNINYALSITYDYK